jgi:uncharacterized protein
MPSSHLDNKTRAAFAEDRPTSNAVPKDSLALLGWPVSLIKLVRYFALHPNDRMRFRELQRKLGVGGESLKRDLARLVAVGALQRIDEGQITKYAVAPNPRLWSAFLGLIRELSNPVTLVREAFRDVRGIDAAFIYGSVARCEARPDSDIDIFVVGDKIDRPALYENLAELGVVLGKEVNSIRYSKAELAHRLASKTRFVREVLGGEKLWVAGNEDELAPLAIAAGVTLKPAATMEA